MPNLFNGLSRGDTIIEVLLAIGIASFSIGITYATAQHSLQQSATAKEHNQALNYIDNQITDLKLRYQKSSTDFFNQNFTFTGGKNHFCLDDGTTDPNKNWLPYLNLQSGVDESSPLKGAAAPSSTNPYNDSNPSNSCVRNKAGDGITYYIDIQTSKLSAVSQYATLYQVIVRWEPPSGNHVNQASEYYRINGGTASAFGATPASSTPPVPSLNYGYDVHIERVPDPQAYVNLAKAGGATAVSDDIIWSVAEPAQNSWNWSVADKIISYASSVGLYWHPIATYAPSWASGCANTDKCGPTPAHYADYANFVKQIIQRYGSNGSYVTSHPGTLPIEGISIWNEPNQNGFWQNPDPAAYTAMLKLAYAAAKATDSSVPVVAGNLAAGGVPSSSPNYWTSYLKTMYSSGAKGNFDALGVHPYCFYSGATADQMLNTAGCGWAQMVPIGDGSSIRDIMVNNGDSSTKIWVTEFGAPTQVVTKAAQGDLALKALTQWRQFISDGWAGNFFWYDLRDGDSTSDITSIEYSFGTTESNGSPKPSYTTLQTNFGTL